VSNTKTRLGLDPDCFAQQLRLAHCAHAHAGQADHVCVGECQITREGIELTCAACGDGAEPLVPIDVEPAKSIIEAAGINWSSLSLQAQRAAVGAARGRKPRW
jgi:hypothetical protein